MLKKLYHYSLSQQWFRHALAWTFYIQWMYLNNQKNNPESSFMAAVLLGVFIVPVFYWFYYLLKLISKRKTTLKGIMLLSSSTFGLAVLAYWHLNLVIPGMGAHIQKPGVPFNKSEFLMNYFLAFYRIFGYALLYFFYRKEKKAYRKTLQQNERLAKLKKEKNELEIARLKMERERDKVSIRFYRSQIHPHFLRNGLNSILGMVIAYKNELLNQTIENLSKVLNYSLSYSKSDEPTVFIKKEVAVLHAFVAIMRLQAGSRCAVDFSIVGESAGHTIPPLSLLTFLENILKHGTFSEADPTVIRLALDSDRLIFYCRNRKTNRPSDEDGSGLGIANVRQRLRQAYKDNFNLSIQEDEFYYAISLTINYDYEQNFYLCNS